MQKELIVIIRGGCVSEVLANCDDVAVQIFDLDDMTEEEADNYPSSYEQLKKDYPYEVY